MLYCLCNSNDAKATRGLGKRSGAVGLSCGVSPHVEQRLVPEEGGTRFIVELQELVGTRELVNDTLGARRNGPLLDNVPVGYAQEGLTMLTPKARKDTVW